MGNLRLGGGKQRFRLRLFSRLEVDGGEIQRDVKSLPKTDGKLNWNFSIPQFREVCEVLGDDSFVMARSQIRSIRDA